MPGALPGIFGNNAPMLDRLKATYLLLPALWALATASGCGLFNSLPVGTITGVVLYNGEPAAGRRVNLIGAGSSPHITDANGRYTFTGIRTGTVQVVYHGTSDRPDQFPNEVDTWTSAPVDATGGGADLPAFDVSYNGLLYPDVAMSLLVAPNSPVPFHWSTQLNAERYRLHVGSQASSFSWASDWSSDPTAIFAKSVDPGSYQWWIEIDGGDKGTGKTRPRTVDLSPPDAPAPAGS